MGDDKIKLISHRDCKQHCPFECPGEWRYFDFGSSEMPEKSINVTCVESMPTTDTIKYSKSSSLDSTNTSSQTDTYVDYTTFSNTISADSTIITYITCGIVAFLVVSIVSGIFVWKQKVLKKRKY